MKLSALLLFIPLSRSARDKFSSRRAPRAAVAGAPARTLHHRAELVASAPRCLLREVHTGCKERMVAGKIGIGGVRSARVHAEWTRATRPGAHSRLGRAAAARAQAERAVHCEGVRPGKARVFNCLLAAAGYADFSGACREQLARGQARRVKDWRLDYDLRMACKEDVPKARLRPHLETIAR